MVCNQEKRKRTHGVRKGETQEAKLKRIQEAKLKSTARWRAAACRSHLAELQLTAGVWTSIHSKKALLKGAPDCDVGGWKCLVQSLLDGKVPDTCATCTTMLQKAGFNMENLQKDLNPETTSLPVLDSMKESDKKSKKGQGAEPVPIDDKSDEDEDGPVDVLQMVQDDPNLELLPRNFDRRRYPVRCNLCSHKSSKKCAIFDLVNPKKVKYLKQHLNTHGHRKRLAAQKLEEKMKSSSSTYAAGPCQGLLVEACSQKCQLREVMDQFKLWVSYNSMHALAAARNPDDGHQYLVDLKMNGNIIIHQACDKVATPVANGERPVCKKCRSLESDRSLVRTVAKFNEKHLAARDLAAIGCNVQVFEGFVGLYH